ncbi:hypothetical protein V6Z12_A10G263300 [Gossypium hirsutum]
MTTSIHVTALDSVVNVNSLFTLAVFIGLAWNPYDPSNTLVDPNSRCAPTSKIAEDLIKFHVYSFSSFLFSSLVALAIKQAIKLSKSHTFNIHVTFRGSEFLEHVDVNKTLLRIKVGTLACGSGHAFAAVVPLVILVPLALLIYVCVGLYAFTRFNGVYGTSNYYGPCGKHDIEKEAQKLAPCTYAAKYFRAPVSERCCTIMEKKLNNPSCLCAILQSHTVYNAGVRPEVAVTIPKRCNIAVRPVGHKCGAFPFV